MLLLLFLSFRSVPLLFAFLLIPIDNAIRYFFIFPDSSPLDSHLPVPLNVPSWLVQNLLTLLDVLCHETTSP